jgi:hypothetical protein
MQPNLSFGRQDRVAGLAARPRQGYSHAGDPSPAQPRDLCRETPSRETPAVIPWTLIDSAKLPGQGELRLKRRGSEFSIMLGTNELMNSRLSGSEEALATLACTQLRDAPHPQILIGGLGMGFTLRAALQVLGPGARVELAELVPEVVAWAKGPMAEVFAGCLDDPRVTVTVTDVGAAIAAARSSFTQRLRHRSRARRHSGQAAQAAPIRNPSKGDALYDGFRVSASLRPE